MPTGGPAPCNERSAGDPAASFGGGGFAGPVPGRVDHLTPYLFPKGGTDEDGR